jgi:alpha-glucosidase (family GH31 glycosyl hydrolase)
MKKLALLALALFMTICSQATNEITGVRKLNPTTIEIYLTSHRTLTFDFYGDNIFRLFQDNSGGIIRDPQAKPDAKILVDNPRRSISKLNVTENNATVTISTSRINIIVDKSNALFKVTNLKSGNTVIEQLAPVSFDKGKVRVTLKENAKEYFYGGGVQNGRFSHKGKKIAIENQNSWTDNGVASPAPFYWSTGGYAVMCYTFGKGMYDFGATEKGKVVLSHETNYLDMFFMIDDGAVALLNDYYQLTGNPVLLPKFAFYEGHLNAYNRDYWKEDAKGILFEDGKRYKESQKDNGGTKESLNGEKNNYQFSARAVIDRYKSHDMPLGWILPNDGYGAGYGQTTTLDGNIANLKSFGDYARKNGVEIGLWTQSDLHPKAGVSALLQRDIVKEVRDAGVRVLKTDVAWVGDGYSFGLNGVSDVGHIMPYYGNNARPFIISLDGWAGTQRYAGIWTGDQTGGEWEYIRFHIPTYIGSGLSGIPNITSDMDGIFGGKNLSMNARDFEWKTFTPMQLNMDGWGANEKYPFALGEPATSINRNYLKLKSQLIPYTYSIAKEAVDGMPIIRAMFLQYPNDYTMGKSTEYQYMYGPSFLVAPIYQQTKADAQGNDIRNGIYLPEGRWIDYFSGEVYNGNAIINNFDAPLWKLPLFVKAGAIIPMTNANNHVNEINRSQRIYEVYPYGKSSFNEYDDDGISEAYQSGNGATTLIEQQVAGRTATITVHPTKGNFDGFVKNKSTEFRVNVTARPQSVTATIGKAKVALTAAKSKEEFEKKQNTYFYDAAPNFNQFATKGSDFEKTVIAMNPKLLVKLAATDITANSVKLTVGGFVYAPADKQRVSTGALTVPANAKVTEANTTAYTLTPSWDKVTNADYYEILFGGNTYSTIKDNSLLFDGLTPLTKYTFKVRAVNKSGVSDWSTFEATTKSNPLEFAIHSIHGELTCAEQEGFEISHLFDFNESGDIWHTKYRANALPYDMTIDLRSINTIDRFDYIPRADGGNGTLLKGSVSYSLDKENWTPAGNFEWKADGTTKSFAFGEHPTVRYIKLSVTNGVNNYGSGRELYVFKVPGTATLLPGDVNKDGKIDSNDLTSYTNYTGLRKGDSDFDGYISDGDINHNGLIDAYDISVVATQLEDGIADDAQAQKISGSLSIAADKESYKKDEDVTITVKGNDLKAVNALSMELPYSEEDYEFVSIQPVGMKAMMNMTNDRLHKNGEKALYPTFVNVGDKETLNGTADLFIIKLKAKRKVKFELKPANVLLVDKYLNVVQ